MTPVFIICTAIMALSAGVYAAVYVRDRRETKGTADALDRLNLAWERRLEEAEAQAAALRAMLLECRASIAQEAARATHDPRHAEYAANYRTWLERIDAALAGQAGGDLLRVIEAARAVNNYAQQVGLRNLAARSDYLRQFHELLFDQGTALAALDGSRVEGRGSKV